MGCTTAEYVGSSGTAEATGCTVTEIRDVIGDEADQPSEDEGEYEEVSTNVNRSSSSSHALPVLFFLIVNLLVDALTMTTSLKLLLRYCSRSA